MIAKKFEQHVALKFFILVLKSVSETIIIIVLDTVYKVRKALGKT